MNRLTRNKVIMLMVVAMLLICIANLHPNRAEASGTLNVPITVKESSGGNSNGFPVTTVIPLPYGEYQNTSSFRVTDSGGNTVPAQFEVLNRHWSKDNSIRHVTVNFQPTVTGGSSATYYLKDDGTGDSGGALTVTETAELITVNTGPLQFTVNKVDFNLFDSVTYNGQSVITSSSQNGGALVDRFNQTQYDAEMAAPTVTIEENGPLRAVIRAELPAKFRLTGQYASYQPGINKIHTALEQGDYTHEHGYIVRIYAYSGKSFVKTDYSLANSDKTVLNGWPLYFDDFSLGFQMPTTWNNVKIGGEATHYEGTVSTGKYIYTHDDASNVAQPAYVVKDGAGADLATDTTVGSGFKAPGWIDLSGTDGEGMMVAVKNFWQTWPNGLQVDSDKKVSIRLFPKWGQGSYWVDGDYIPTTTGLYWLDDMQHITKSILFYFHGSATSSVLDSLSKQFQKEPIGTLPVDWYRTTAVTLDKGGTVPLTVKRPSPANTNVDLSSTQVDMTHFYYNLGYNNYLGDVSRRAPNTTGGYPNSVANFIATENPKYYYTAEAQVLSGTLNTRPQWLSGYDYETGAIPVPSLNKSFHPVAEAPYGSGSYRMRWPIASGVSKSVAPYIAGTDETGWGARDYAHMWMYENEEFYYYSGDKLLYDWYKFLGEFVKTTILGTANEAYEFADGSIGQTRAIGHMLGTLMQAYRIVGDPTFLDAAKIAVKKLTEVQYKYGGFDNNNEGWQIGMLAASLTNFLEEVKGSDEQAYADAFGVLHGIIEFNANYSKYGYYMQPDDNQDEAYERTEPSSGTSATHIDAEAWWYYHTGDSRVLNNLKDYIAGEYGNSPIGVTPIWDGGYYGRQIHEAMGHPKADETPPPAIMNLTATPLGGGQVRIDWTGPADAVNYHVRWATSPISGTQTQEEGKINWWKAKAIGNSLTGSGAQTLTVSNVPNNAILYYAVRSFDAAENMSDMSNVASAVIGTGDITAPAAVSNLSASGTTGYSTLLNWTSPGDDGSSGSAIQYDIRYSTAPITTANWSQAMQVTETVAPRSAGRNQTLTVGGLSGNTTYYLAMKSIDDASNVSGLSNIVTLTTGAPDLTPPSATVLTTDRRTSDSIALSWTAPGNDGSTGTAHRYDIRYSTAPITDANWNSAITAVGAPVPSIAGTAQSMIVSGLSPNTAYYFGMKTLDLAYGASALSNIVQVNTTPVNLALNKAGITASKDVQNKPAAVLTDGNVGVTGWMRLITGPQWVRVDLEHANSIASIHLLHRYSSNQIYRDVIVQLSNDPTFATGVTTVFNNDINNSAGQGIGTDAEYMATSAGKDFLLAQPVTARYVRVWTNGSNVSSSYSDFMELSVYGSTAVAAPSAPLNVAATPAAGQVTLGWSASNGADSYNVKRSTVSGGPYTNIASTVTAVTYTDSSVTNGTTYYYVVSAVNSGGESANSAQALATPSSGAALSRVGWTATGSSNTYSPANALDGNISTRWATSRSQIPGLYYQVNMGDSKTFNKITLDSGSNSNDYPRGYEIYVSSDGTNWGSAVVSGAGSGSIQTISFQVQTAQYIKVVLTGAGSPWWSMSEFNVYEP